MMALVGAIMQLFGRWKTEPAVIETHRALHMAFSVGPIRPESDKVRVLGEVGWLPGPGKRKPPECQTWSLAPQPTTAHFRRSP